MLCARDFIFTISEKSDLLAIAADQRAMIVCCKSHFFDFFKMPVHCGIFFSRERQ
jgi:hypothetical protein